jgi:hypothetical protein
MTLDNRIQAFSRLGEFLKQFSDEAAPVADPLNKQFYDECKELIKQVSIYNAWFTEQNVRQSIAALADNLTKQKLERWMAPYRQELDKQTNAYRVAVIMAGNVPLVGFHDFLCVLLSGNQFIGKLSSEDKLLLPYLSKILVAIEPRFKECIEFTEGQLKNMQAVIATGSNNTSRYFEYYFSKYPSIIRKNRNSVAVLTGRETKEELELLGKDVFQYFGLGCRNVSKLFVPKAYSFDLFYEAMIEHQEIIQANKYANNYDYNSTVYLMSNDPTLLDNNFLLLKESPAYASPIGVLYYEFYDDLNTLKTRLDKEAEQIQCIVSSHSGFTNAVPFGQAQCPALNDYADGVDTMKFLTGLQQKIKEN